VDTATTYDLLLATPAPKFKVDFTQISTLPNEITFSRAGNAMQFDATGALTWAPNNLLTYSDNLSNAAWTQNGIGTGLAPTATANYAAGPNGTVTATRLQMDLGATPASAYSRTYQGVLGTSLSSAWFKTTDGTTKNLFLVTGAGARPLISVTGTWTQFYSLNSAGAGLEFGLSGGAGTSSTADILVWHARSSFVTYETTPRASDDVSTTTAAYYGPRFDNTMAVANSPLGLLIEEARTNVVLWNRDLTNAAWTLGATMTRAKDQIGIDGVANSASSITGGLVSATNTILQAVVLGSSARFQSAYVKRLVGTGVVNMTTDGGTTWTAITVTSTYTRVTIPTQTLANPSVGFQIMTSTDSIAVDFVQNENGVVVTSPIFTTTAAVTRAADVAQLAGRALNLVQSAIGTLVAEFVGNGPISDVYLLSVAANNPPVFIQTGANIRQYNGSRNLGSVPFTIGEKFRLGVSFSSSGTSFTAKNAAVATDGNAWVASAPTVFYLGTNSGNGAFVGYLTNFALYNKRLPNLTLQAKTVLGAPL
jgi:hypothetical protein